MTTDAVVFTLLGAADRITTRLDRSLADVKGISFSEYQLLAALHAQPRSSATRVELARLVGRSPSGVTRALKPLEKLGFVATVKDGRDARRSLATLTPDGVELTSDAAGVVADVIADVTAGTSVELTGPDGHRLQQLLDGLAPGF